jgi:hypothetical protein
VVQQRGAGGAGVGYGAAQRWRQRRLPLHQLVQLGLCRDAPRAAGLGGGLGCAAGAARQGDCVRVADWSVWL